MNKVIISGNLTKDIELKKTNTGKSYCSFTVAINDGGDKTTFIDCQAWDKTAEIMDTFVGKGAKVIVDGRIAVYDYDTQNGKGKKVYVVADRVEFTKIDNKPKSNVFEVAPDDLPFI